MPRFLTTAIAAMTALAMLGCPDAYDSPPTIDVTPSSADFGAIPVGSPVQQIDLVFTNTDDRDATLLEATLTGDVDVFEITGTDGGELGLPKLVAPEDTTRASIQFVVPDEDGAYAATATFMFSVAVEEPLYILSVTSTPLT